MNYNDTSAANELKKIIVALGGADSIYDIPGQKSDDVIRDLAKAVENAIANGTLGGNSGPTAEWGDPLPLMQETEINILTAPEDDTSEEFLLKIANDSKNTLIDYGDVDVNDIILNNSLSLKINGKYYLFQFSSTSVTRMDASLFDDRYSLDFRVTDTTGTFRLYSGLQRFQMMDGTSQMLSVFTIVDQLAKKDYSATVIPYGTPSLQSVSGSWHYRLVGRAPIKDPPKQDHLTIQFEPLKHRDFGELSLLAVIYVDGSKNVLVIKPSALSLDEQWQPIGLNIFNVSEAVMTELHAAFHHIKSTLTEIAAAAATTEGRLTFTLSL